MKRCAHPPRPEFAQRAAEMGFRFHTIEGTPYWRENAHYEFSALEIDVLEDATQELEQMCIDSVSHMVRDGGYYQRFGLSNTASSLIEASWKNGHKAMYGRMDFAWDGSGWPKLLEYNADTPTALFETSVVQWEWLNSFDPSADQFNSIHEKLIEAWKAYGLKSKLHFTSIGPDLPGFEEDFGTTEYMRDTASQAGLDTEWLAIDDLGWTGVDFTTPKEEAILALWKLYPWEWMVQETYAPMILHSRCLMIEPAWKMLLSNKAILAVLWERFPNHQYLLPAFQQPGRTGVPEVSKPLLGREGANVQLPGEPETDGIYGHSARVWQAHTPMPRFDDQYAVIGSWVVGGQSAGIGIREDTTAVTRNTSCFVPHLFR